MARRSIAVMLSLALLACPAPAAAAPPSPDKATKEAARTLGKAGLARYDRRDWTGALEKFTQAYSLYKAPTLGLLVARCQVKLGALATAAETYLEVTQLELERGAPRTFRKAQKDAARERAALLPRVPKITIVIEPANGDTPTVTLDGAPLDNSALGQPQRVNAGSHQVEARRGDASAQQAVQVQEGDDRRVVLRFAAAPPPDAPPPDLPINPETPGSTQRTIGWVSVGAGACGLVAGAILGGLAAAKRGDLDDAGCMDGHCPRALQSDVDTYNTMRTASGISLIAGAVILAAGGTFLWTAPSPASPPPASRSTLSVAPAVGWASLGVVGSF